MRRFPSNGWIVLVVALGLAALDLAAGTDLANRLKGLRMTLRPRSNDAAVVRLSIQEARLDHQRRGFFKIGVLPVLVVEDVALEVLEPGSLASTLADLPAALMGDGHRVPIELRNFSLRFPGDETPRFLAGRVRLAGRGVWQLSGPVAWRTTASQGLASQASLQVAGAQAGWLTLTGTNAPQMVDLFSDERISQTQSDQRTPE